MEKTVAALLLAKFPSYNEKQALRFKTRYRTFSFSYQDLCHNVLKTATFLKSQKLKKGDRIVIYSYNSPQWCILFLACSVLGIIAVPVDFSSSIDFAKKIARITKAKAVFSSFTKPLNAKREFVIEDLLTTISPYPRLKTAPRIRESDILEIVYTSGTTSDPKGVIMTQKNLMSNLLSIHEMFPIESAYHVLSLLPLSHLFEQTLGFFIPLYHGATITYLSTMKPRAIMNACQEERITTMVVVPAFLNALKDSITREIEKQNKKKGFNLLLRYSSNLPHQVKQVLFRRIHKKLGGNFKFFVVGGAPLDNHVEDFWNAIGITVYQGYGATEASPVISCNTPWEHKPHTVGRVIPGVSVEFNDGEILVKGENVTQGYFNNKKATRESFNKNGYHTGDIGTLDQEGFLNLKGRKKNMILSSSGMNVYPEDIESVIRPYSFIKDCCVLGTESKGETTMTAVILLKSRMPISSSALMEQINGKLSPHQKVKAIVIWKSHDFPRTPSMKIKRNELLSMLQKRNVKEAAHIQMNPFTRMIQQVTHASTNKIKPSSLLVRDLHLTSLQRVELLSQIEDEYGLELDESVINEKTRVADLESAMKNASIREHASLVKDWQLSLGVRSLRNALQQFLFSCMRLFYPLRVEGLGNLARLSLPAVFVCNHVSHLDTLTVLNVLPEEIRRRIAVAAAADYFFEVQPGESRTSKKMFSFLARLVFNAYPFSRGLNVKHSFEAAGKLLDLGYSILIYPEGTRATTGIMNPFKSGIGLLASQMSVPIIPLRSHGLYEVLPKGASIPRKNEVTMVIGKPMVFSASASPIALTKQVESAVKAL